MSKNHTNTPRSSGGFTLIELLILILILAVFASITIFSVSKARTKGQNSSIELALAPLYYESQKLYDQRGTHGNWIFGSLTEAPNCQVNTSTNPYIAFFFYPHITNIIKSASQKSGGVMNGTSITRTACRLNTNGTWAVAVTSKDNTGAYCVDSSGLIKLVNKDTLKSGSPDFSIANPNNPIEAILNGGSGAKISCK